MVPCRRCPSAYHLTCMPPELHPEKAMLGRPQRVWIAHRNPDGGFLGRSASCSWSGCLDLQAMRAHLHKIVQKRPPTLATHLLRLRKHQGAFLT